MSEVAELLRRVTLGVYVVGVAHEGRRNAFTAAWLMPVSFDPVLVALSVNVEHASYPLLRESGRFTVSVLAPGQIEIARHLGTTSARAGDKLGSLRWRAAGGGAPLVEDAVAHFEAAVIEARPAGDHQLVVARVTAGALLKPDVVPLTYADTGDMDGSARLYPPRL